jgi:hypothetical protein
VRRAAALLATLALLAAAGCGESDSAEPAKATSTPEKKKDNGPYGY